MQIPFDRGKNSLPTIFSRTELFPELCAPTATICGRDIISLLMKKYEFNFNVDYSALWEINNIENTLTSQKLKIQVCCIKIVIRFTCQLSTKYHRFLTSWISFFPFRPSGQFYLHFRRPFILKWKTHYYLSKVLKYISGRTLRIGYEINT